MSCNHRRYLGVVKRAVPVVSGNNLIIDLGNFCKEINQGDYVDVIICCNFDYPECIGNVIFVANEVNFIAIKVGVVKSDQIKKRTNYRLIFGTEFNTATICTDICPSKYPFPSVPVPTVTISKKEGTHPFIDVQSTTK